MENSDTPATQPTTANAPVPDRRVPLRPILLVVAAIAATVALAAVSRRITDIVGLTIFALAITWLSRPLYAWCARRMGAGLALVVTTLTNIVVAGAIAGVVLADLNNGATRLAARISNAVANGQSGLSTFDRIVHALKLGDNVTRWLTELPGTFIFGVDGQPQIAQRVIDLLVAIVLAAFFHASATPMLARFVAVWPRHEREATWRLLRDVDVRANTFLLKTAAVALGGAAAAAGLGLIYGLPTPVALGVWLCSWAAVSNIGILIGMLPMVAAALILRPWKAAIVIAVALAIAIVVRRLRHHWVAGTNLRPGVGVTTIALAAGVAYSGSGAALLCYIIAVVAVATITSRQREGVRLPMPTYDEDDAYRWGPLIIPKGYRGALLIAVVIVAAMIAWTVLTGSGLLIVWLSLAILFAVAIDRPADYLQRHLHLPRTGALLATFAVIAAVTGAIFYSMTTEGPTSAAKAVQKMPDVLRRLENWPLIGDWLRDQHAATKVADYLARLPRIIGRSRGAANWLPAFGSQLVDVVWVLLLTIALAADGGRMTRAFGRHLPARQRRQYTRLMGVSHKALAGYAAGAVVVSAMNGTVVLILALVLKIGLAPVLALWAFLWDFVPQVGGFIGGVPLLLFALVVGPGPFVIAAVVYILYQLIETNVIYPAVIGPVIDIPAWAAMLAALVGAAAGGVIGAVIATPLVGVVRLVWSEMRSEAFPGRVVAPSPVDTTAAAVGGGG